MTTQHCDHENELNINFGSVSASSAVYVTLFCQVFIIILYKLAQEIGE